MLYARNYAKYYDGLSFHLHTQDLAIQLSKWDKHTQKDNQNTKRVKNNKWVLEKICASVGQIKDILAWARKVGKKVRPHKLMEW